MELNQMEHLEELIGATVSEVWMEMGEGSIIFKTDKGVYRYPVEGDCCSQSWFSDIYGLVPLFESPVVAIVELGMEWYSIDDDRCRHTDDVAYGYQIRTEYSGTTTIVFRNSSNGYYGGNLAQVEILHEVPTEGYTQIKDDWKA
jgi:hypothetical protein